VFAALSESESNPGPADHATLLGLGEGLKRARRTLRQAAADPISAKAVDHLLTSARRQSLDATTSPEARVQAIELLSLDDFDLTRPTLTQLLNPRQPQEVQRAAVAALSAVNRPEVATILLSPWRTYTPALRTDVIQAMLGYKNRLPALLDGVAAGKIPVTQIPPSRRNLLLKSADPEIASRAAKLFTTTVSPRAEVIARYTPALDLKGDPARGHVVYQSICITCHRSGDTQTAEGNDVGPNLATVREWDAQRLLVNILDPNREVAPNYVEYVLTLKNGETLTGLIADETAASITLKRASLPPLTILRQDILRMTSSGLSLMPENLEAGITPQQMADLIAYLTRRP
jgi:putative heme-binding domain-containing protein